jgi:hypothetical protein
MKKFMLLVLFVLCSSFWGWCDTEIITEEINTPAFDKIQINHGYVRFHQSNENRVIVSADSYIDKYVVIEVRDNTLIIGIRDLPLVKFDVFSIDVYGYVTDVSINTGTFECMEKVIASSFGIDIHGNGTLRMDIQCDDISIKSAGIGTIEGYIECDNFRTEISGGSYMKINGMCKTAYISCNTPGGYGTFGTLDSIDFVTDETTIIIDGPVTANVNTTKELNVTVSKDGRINYCGNPKTNINGNNDNVRKIG